MSSKANHRRPKRGNTRSRRRTVVKRKRAHRPPRKKSAGPRTLRQFAALSSRSQDRWNRVTQAVSKMRKDGISLRQAAKDYGLDPSTVKRWAKAALRKRSNGRYAARTKDSLLRMLTIPTAQGLREVAVRDSRQASRLGAYWAAVQKYLRTGDASALAKFQGKRITDASRKRLPLITNLQELNRLGSADTLSFESLYAHAA